MACVPGWGALPPVNESTEGGPKLPGTSLHGSAQPHPSNCSKPAEPLPPHRAGRASAQTPSGLAFLTTLLDGGFLGEFSFPLKTVFQKRLCSTWNAL